ncbi:MAG TPA: hypothetical protein VGF22_21525 [Acidimicrobiales bacterium]
MLGRAGRVAAFAAVALLALLLAAAEPRAVLGSFDPAAAVDQYATEAATVAAVPAPRVKPTDGQPVGKRTLALVAALAIGTGTAMLAVSLLGAVASARRARRPRWAPGGIRAPPASLSL